MQSRAALALVFIASMLTAPRAWLHAMPQRQDAGDKPVLIREPEEAQEPEAERPLRDPLLAEKHLEVANYYFKKRNYDAAISRCLEAIKYKPDYADAYRLLGKAYEKNRDYAGAMSAYRKYISQYPNSTAAKEFSERIAELEGRAEKGKEPRAQSTEHRR